MSDFTKGLTLILALILVGFTAGSAMAVGTSGDTGVIINGLFTSTDTLPQQLGRVSLAYQKSSTNKDSNYKGPGGQSGDSTTGTNILAVTVDTAYDMLRIGQPSDKNGGIGDTVSFAYQIGNLGNATFRIYFDSSHPSSMGDSDWTSQKGSYRVYWDTNNDGLWVTSDTIVPWGQYLLAPGATDTVILVVLVPTSANEGESSFANIKMSDNAPLKNGSTTGDGWETGVPRSFDGNDTQYDTTITTVTAPNVIVSKTVSEVTAGLSRPGDTLQFVVSFDNDGSDSARGLVIYDVIPDNTRYVWNSADTNQGGGDTTALLFSLAYDSDAVSTNSFGDTGIPASSGSYVTAIRWTLTNALGEDNGDKNNTVNYDGAYDNGRVRFQVWIQ